jgi:hypothetical protein
LVRQRWTHRNGNAESAAIPTDCSPVFRTALEFLFAVVNNERMVIAGRVHKGVVILEGGAALPEGAAVTVSYPASPPKAAPGQRIKVPLIRSDRPGSVSLTGARIAEILDEEDASSGH